MTHRGALIGCGFFAANHMHGWAEIGDAEIIAVCDRDAGRAQAMAERFGIPATYTDAAEMLAREQLDFVDIATTSGSHRTLVELAAPHVRLVICQKPMADSLADGAAMVAAAGGAGIPLVIHENFRWQRPFREIARRVAEGDLGTIHFARFSFRHGYDNYVNQPYLAEIERFTIMDVGLHLFDLSRHFVGEATTLSCRTQRLNPKVRGEDAFTALIGHESGATSAIDCSFFSKLSPHRFPQTTAWIEGDRGTIELDEDYRMTVHGPDGRQTFDVEPEVPAWGEQPWHIIQDSVVAFERHVVEVLEGKAPPQPSGEDNLKTLAMALAAYEAAASDSVIDLRQWKEMS
ncbi:MAG TPA: Gfo/Idh/MocA family oxidoreductase [Devosiaceae bacterium]|jgi:predicted dehydrogenase|nr:Gfo/Idh/MocA family oxidoreductase [Devosiaceae bacterium]